MYARILGRPGRQAGHHAGMNLEDVRHFMVAPFHRGAHRHRTGAATGLWLAVMGNTAVKTIADGAA